MTQQYNIQKIIKRHKKKATQHTAIAAIISVFIVAVFYFLDRATEASVSSDKDARVTIGIVGDMMFGRNIELVGDKYGYDGLFKYVQPYLHHADFMTGNFENPIVRSSDYPKADKFIHLKTRLAVAGVVSKMNFKLLNLANNHIKDYGERGLQDTTEAFKKTKVGVVGAGDTLRKASAISYHMAGGLRIAAIGISDVLPKNFGALRDRSGVVPANPSLFIPLIQEAKNNADLVLVHVHWGVEYDSKVHPRQTDLGHVLVDAGTDIVIGHHPHVLEPLEIYKGGVIFYSLGNFIFDQGWSRTKESVLVYYKILHDGTVKLELHPIFIQGGTPRPVLGWKGRYRREKIFSQITQERMYTRLWDRTWTRQEDMIYRKYNREGGVNS